MSSIACPSCSTGYVEESRVLETRITPAGLRRRRLCKRGHKFTTIEIVVTDHYPINQEITIVRNRDLAKVMRILGNALSGDHGDPINPVVAADETHGDT